jgi:hypothetical protein
MGIATLTAAGVNPVTVNLAGSAAAVGGGFSPQTGGGVPVTWRDSTLSTAAANAVARGGNEAGRVIVTLAGSANTTVDLRSIVDLLGSTVVLARCKWISFRNLSSSDDSVNVTTTPATCVTVGGSGANDWVSQGAGGAATFGPAAATWAVNLRVGGRVVLDAGPDDAAGCVADATHRLVKITNLDTVNTAKVEVCFGGGDS